MCIGDVKRGENLIKNLPSERDGTCICLVYCSWYRIASVPMLIAIVPSAEVAGRLVFYVE